MLMLISNGDWQLGEVPAVAQVQDINSTSILGALCAGQDC